MYIKNTEAITPEIAKTYLAAEEGYSEAVNDAARTAWKLYELWERWGKPANEWSYCTEEDATSIGKLCDELGASIEAATGFLTDVNRLVKEHVSESPHYDDVFATSSCGDIVVAWYAVWRAVKASSVFTRLYDGRGVCRIDWNRVEVVAATMPASFDNRLGVGEPDWDLWDLNNDNSLLTDLETALKECDERGFGLLEDGAEVLSRFVREIVLK